MKKKLIGIMLCAAMVAGLAAGCNKSDKVLPGLAMKKKR